MTKKTNATANKSANAVSKKTETVKQDKQQKTFVNMFKLALVARKEKAPIEQHKQIDYALTALSDAVVESAQKVMTQTDFNAVSAMLKNHDKAMRANYMQVKSIVKLSDIVRAIAQGIKPTSGNLNIALSAMMNNANHANVKELIVSQSKAARETDLTNIRSDFQARSASYTVGTASSQTGQVREVMRVLNLATVTKGKRNDDAKLTEYGLAMLAKVYPKA